MTSISMFVTSLVICIALASVTKSCKRQEMDRENLKKLAVANNELAFNLNRLLIRDSSENVFFSPYSISVVFAILFYGARGNTEQELRKALGYDKANLPSDNVPKAFNFFLSEIQKNPSDEYTFNEANAIFVDENLDLLDDYKTKVGDYFKADVREVDFINDATQIVDEVNDFVNEKTKGKIEKLLDELDPSTVLLLLDAVYFKGDWKTQFNKTLTRDEIFYNNGMESAAKEVPLMHLTSNFPFASVGNFKALELPYKGDNISMIILLPNNLDGLQDLENCLTPEKLSDILKKMYKTKVEVSLPKFQLQFEKELTSEFKALGASQIFSPGSADFSGLTSQQVSVSQINHKAVIEVNEEGSEAAAVTGTGVTATAEIIPENFKADHPFLFAILEKRNNLVLFLGSVNSL